MVSLRTVKREDGFTLIELLVVIIIIGILAAIAVPVFLNQRQRAVDGALVSNTRSVANAIQEGLVSYPDARYIVAFDNESSPPSSSVSTNVADENGDGHIFIGVGNNATDAYFTQVAVNEGFYINTHTVSVPPGEYRIRTWNPNGKRYVDSSTGYLWQSNTGGQRD